MNITNEIFELLKIEPETEFNLISKGKILDAVFKFDSDLNLFIKKAGTFWTPAAYTLRDIVSGDKSIVHKFKLTKEDKIILDYLKLCGYKYIRQSGIQQKAYKQRPHFIGDKEVTKEGTIVQSRFLNGVRISFLKSETGLICIDDIYTGDDEPCVN